METSNVITSPNRFNRVVYFAFIAIGILQIVFGRNTGDAVIYFGLALCFDPFDQKVRWDDRARYQKVWLYVHLAVVLSFIGILFFK